MYLQCFFSPLLSYSVPFYLVLNFCQEALTKEKVLQLLLLRQQKAEEPRCFDVDAEKILFRGNICTLDIIFSFSTPNKSDNPAPIRGQIAWNMIEISLFLKSKLMKHLVRNEFWFKKSLSSKLLGPKYLGSKIFRSKNFGSEMLGSKLH